MTPVVYFTSICTANGESLPRKLARLAMTAANGSSCTDIKNTHLSVRSHKKRNSP